MKNLKTIQDIIKDPRVYNFIQNYDGYGKHLVEVHEGYKFEEERTIEIGNVSEICYSMNNNLQFILIFNNSTHNPGYLGNLTQQQVHEMGRVLLLQSQQSKGATAIHYVNKDETILVEAEYGISFDDPDDSIYYRISKSLLSIGIILKK